MASSARRLCRCCLAAAALVRGRGARLLVRRAREVLEAACALYEGEFACFYGAAGGASPGCAALVEGLVARG